MLAAGLLTLLAPVAVWAQVTTGNVFGTVKDAQGGVLPGATVVLISETRGTKIGPVVTDEIGNFVVPNVTADTYTVEVSMQGFKELLRPGVAVSGGDRVQLGSLVLEVGTLTETVQVTGETPLDPGVERRALVCDAHPRRRQPAALAPEFRGVWRRSVQASRVGASEEPPDWAAAARTTTRWTACPRWTPGTTVS